MKYTRGSYLCRGMQQRYFVAIVLLFSFLIFSIFIHLESEIARLDSARTKLESSLSGVILQDLRLSNRSQLYIHSPSTYNHNNFDPLHSGRSVGLSGAPRVPSLTDDLIVFYNRVPKTGSTSFAGIVYDLCQRNRFHVLHLNVTRNSHTLTLLDQLRFIKNITLWSSKKPALYHGHLAFLDFNKFGLQQQRQPLYVNIVREPIDRLVSYYYFVRHGDDFRPHVRRRKSWDKETLDECVANDGVDCDPTNLWMQVPFFCGHAAACWVPGNPWALAQAKYNLAYKYLVVGITEEIGDFIAVLEAILPRMFNGASSHYIKKGDRAHLRKTRNKIEPSKETIAKIRNSPIWKMEHEFYEFAKKQFNFIKHHLFDTKTGYLRLRKQQFMYEKIRPR